MAESMTVSVAIDTPANVLAEGLEEQDGRALTEVLRSQFRHTNATNHQGA